MSKSRIFCRYFLFCMLINLFSNGYAQEIKSEMKIYQIVPDMIDNPPDEVLSVFYDGNLTANLGNKLTPTDVKSAPTVEWSAKTGVFYVLIMTDLDAPCEKVPILREYQHWIVGNIPSKDIEKGEVLTEYLGAFPSKNSGIHRYVFLVFRQSNKTQFDEKRLTNTSGKRRGKFSTRKFIKKYKLGSPIAGNFFQAEWDSYVPTIEKQLED